MSRIVLGPVPRVEGHARIILDPGTLEVRVVTPSLRGFERFLIGRAVEEVPRLVTHICGICPWAHHLAACKACDALLGVDVPVAAHRLRELAMMAQFIYSHVLQVFVLSGPDLLPGSDILPRGIVSLARSSPTLACRALHVLRLARLVTETLGGADVHPVVSVPGGWTRPLPEEQVPALQEMIGECLDFSLSSIDYARREVFPRALESLMALDPILVSFLGITKDGVLELYDGSLRRMAPDGAVQEFDPADYQEQIAEQVENWSYSKFPYLREAGSLGMDPENPRGVYMVNSLARLNVAESIPTPRAQEELLDFRRQFGRPARHIALFHWARLIELVYACERAAEILARPEITDPHTMVSCEPTAGRGVGVVEAPRGTLIHDYTTDNQGIVVAANIIAGTTHNNAAINLAARRAFQISCNKGYNQAEARYLIEMAVRAFDP